MDEHDITIEDSTGAFPCFLVKTTPDAPAIILIEEIWGLNDHIKDVARRFAKEGYTVLAPELLGDSGILESISHSLFADLRDPAKKDEAQKKVRDALAPMHAPGFGEKMIARLESCYARLHQRHARIAVIGFCFGGTYSFALAANEPGIKAAVPFYGHPPKPETIEHITCPILAFYGEHDENLMKGLPDLEAAMRTHHKDFTHVVYKNTGHAFFNNTNAHMYNKEAADDAWKRALAFLKKHL